MKQLVPEQDVLYTFVMPKSGDKKRYEFIGETDKGRYMMRNIDEQCNVDFSQKWFAFLASRCLLHKEKSPTKIKQDNLNKRVEKALKIEEERVNKETQEYEKTIEQRRLFLLNAKGKTKEALEKRLRFIGYEIKDALREYENPTSFMSALKIEEILIDEMEKSKQWY